jgi:hypothetical protein
MRILLAVEGDEERNIWVDAISPVEVVTENAPPHRVAIRVQSEATSPGERDATVWLRIDRIQAYRLIELLGEHLGASTAKGAEGITKNTILKGPLNGGVNHENGNMLLLFEGKSGLEHRFELPFDQSGLTMEILERAGKLAAGWHDSQRSQAIGEIAPVDLQPRDAESMEFGRDPHSRRAVLSIRLAAGWQFSFFIDKKMEEQFRIRAARKAHEARASASPFITVADDIDWLRDEWCVLYEPPPDADIRRGSAALRRLLVDGMIGKAWRHHGFERQPRVIGPDVEALAAADGLCLEHIAWLVAGGACLNGIEAAMTGAVRAFNPTTGKGPDADEGFAMKIVSITRDARDPSAIPLHPLNELVRRSWDLSKYLDAPGAVGMGTLISRRRIVQFFANHAAGVHLGGVGNEKHRDTAIYEFIAQMENKVIVDTMDGLYFELLSIGQAVGGSADLHKLSEKIRKDQTSALDTRYHGFSAGFRLRAPEEPA